MSVKLRVMEIRNALLVFKQEHAGAEALAKEIAPWLEATGICCAVSEAGCKICLHPTPQIALVLGGDGTILGVARQLAGRNIPILGINFGRVGFLTAIDSDHWQDGLELALAGALPDRACLSLKWQILRAGKEFATGVAINDVVVARGDLARLTSIAVAINNGAMGILRSDGVIISSPLGSSGYSVSAGGPLLHPGLDAIGLTPICSFMQNVSPLVLPGSTVFDLTVEETSADCYLTIDGQEGLALAQGDSTRVSAWPGAIHFLGGEARFFARLKKRAFALCVES